MQKRIIVMAVLLLSTLTSSAYAGRTSFEIRASTLGLGIEVKETVADTLGIRGGINYSTYSFNAATSNVDYEFNIDFLSSPILLDWHPFINSFRLTIGVLINGNKVDLKAAPKGSGTFDINGVTYTASQIGTLKGRIDFNLIDPYFGVGWDTSFDKESGFGFTFELGGIYQGSPGAELSASGPVSGNAAFIRDLAEEEAALRDNLVSFKIYPVVSIGVNYRF